MMVEKNKQKMGWMIMAIVILVGIFIISLSLGKTSTPSRIINVPFGAINLPVKVELTEQEKLVSWLSEKCECVERERLYCPEGFELKKGFCTGEEGYTSASRGCSQYQCENETYDYTDGEWGSQNER